MITTRTTAVLLYALTVTIVFGAPTENFKCPRPNGYFAHPMYCEKYYYCYAKLPKIVECPPGTVFNPEIRDCADGDSVDCGNRLRPAGDSGDAEVQTLVTDEAKQEKPTRDPETPATKGLAVTEANGSDDVKPNSSEEGKETNDNNSDERNDENNESGQHENLAVTERVENQSSKGSEESEESRPYSNVTRVNELTTPGSKEREDDNKNDNTDTQTGGNDKDGDAGLNFQCPVPYGVFPHPAIPTKFIHCSFNIPYVKDCPAKLHFNKDLETCGFAGF